MAITMDIAKHIYINKRACGIELIPISETKDKINKTVANTNIFR